MSLRVVMVHLLLLILTVVSAAVAAPGAADSAYVAEILAWRAERAERLRADDGWLTVAGLAWLQPGDNSFGSERTNAVILPSGSAPPVAGRFVLAGDSVRVVVLRGVPVTCNGTPVVEMTLATDESGTPDVLVLNDLRFYVIKRTKGLGIRLRHLNAPARLNFRGLDYFPVDPSWRIEARFVPYDPPKPVPIPSVVGTVDTLLARGYVEFEREGTIHRLDPVTDSPEDDELFFIFKDATSGEETYPPGRFLSAGAPRDGRVVLDFNRAVNPPCAYTEYATCPLPPPQNALTVRVEAGERNVPGHE